jgi:hypothetical protein
MTTNYNKKCSQESCLNPTHARGWCATHYDRARLSDGSIGDTTFDVITLCLECCSPTGTSKRFCPSCVKTISPEVRRKKYKQFHYAQDRPNYAARNKARVVSPEEARFYNLKYNYGITYEQYLEINDAQGNSCAICGTAEPLTPTGRLHIDHDHETGEVRGLLCMGCNTGIGHLKDNIEVLKSAITYLERSKKSNAPNGVD